MIRILVLSIVFMSCAAQAASSIEGQMKAMLESQPVEKGYDYQLASRCGASPEALANMEMIILRDAEEMKDTYDATGLDFSSLYKSGKKKGDEAYNNLGKDANESPACKQAVEVAQCKRVLGC